MSRQADYIPLSRTFYDREPAVVARDLLGQVVIRVERVGLAAGRIVETEAYLAAGDCASHSYRGRTRRNASMFGPPGHAYVYAIHSRWCLNAVTQPANVGSAVLIRAVEPLEGVALMQQRRGMTDVRNLARGPARLCEAFGIDRELDGWDLTIGDTLWIGVPHEQTDFTVGESPRVGVTSAQDRLLRYFIEQSRFISRPRLAIDACRTPGQPRRAR